MFRVAGYLQFMCLPGSSFLIWNLSLCESLHLAHAFKKKRHLRDYIQC